MSTFIALEVILMDQCTKCNRTFTFLEAWMGYWNGWKKTCPGCSTKISTPMMNRFQVLTITALLPIILWCALTSWTFDDLSTLLEIILLVAMLVMFSLAAPFMERYPYH